MPGISNLTVEQFRDRVNRFDIKYVDHWNSWLNTADEHRPRQLGAILRSWQACRPNTMRRTQRENLHNAPFIDDLITEAHPYIRQLTHFSIRQAASFSNESHSSLSELWNIFEDLSYRGKARNGLAGVVGISKAVLLLTDGRVGPAFDSKVRDHLGIENIEDAKQWIGALRQANQDIISFEQNNQTTICECVPPQHSNLIAGRIYDMALGPGT